MAHREAEATHGIGAALMTGPSSGGAWESLPPPLLSSDASAVLRSPAAASTIAAGSSPARIRGRVDAPVTVVAVRVYGRVVGGRPAVRNTTPVVVPGLAIVRLGSRRRWDALRTTRHG